MAQERSELLSAVGTSFEIVKAIVNAVMAQGGGDDEVRRILRDGKLCREIAERILMPVIQTLNFVADHSRNFNEMLAAGKYDHVVEEMTQENFPFSGGGQGEMERALFHFNRLIFTKDVIVMMARDYWEPDNIAALLSVGEALPKLQLEFPIVALGSVWMPPPMSDRAPFLGSNVGKRILRTGRVDVPWGKHYRFLARRPRK